MPPVDDALAEKMGIKGGVEGLNEDVRKEMNRELNHVLTARNKSLILDRLLDLNPMTLPKALVDSEIEHLQNMTRQQMAQGQKLDKLPDVELPRDPYVEQAEKRVKLGLLLAEVIKAAELKVDEDKVKEKVEDLAASFQKPDEVVKWYYQNREMLAEIEATVLEEDAVAKLMESATITEKSKSYKDALSGDTA